MKTKILLVFIATAAILAASIGAVSLNFRHNGSSVLNSNALNETPNFAENHGMGHGLMRMGLWGRFGKFVTSKQQLGALVQCKTTFVDSAAPVASNVLNVSLNSSGVDKANSKLQADIGSNASVHTLRGDLIAFRGELMVLFGDAFSAVKNKTQVQTLRSDLNGSFGKLQTCISSNTINGTHMHPMMVEHNDNESHGSD
ncbi:MAG: hypothetical protein KGI06_00870 [Candidatus Micrarchaeota archaeon]|nr:hypothetical protein [Candidatus Micrarchaeota archaeon]